MKKIIDLEKIMASAKIANKHFAKAKTHLQKFNVIMLGKSFTFYAKLPDGFEKIRQ